MVTEATSRQIPPPYDEEDAELGGSMTFLEHLTELRERLIKCLVALTVTCTVMFFFANDIIDLIQDRMPIQVELVELYPAEGVMTAFQVSTVAGIFIAFPILFYQAWMFIAPGLYRRERKVVLPTVFSAWFCFVVGGLFCYFVLLNFMFSFLATFLDIRSTWSINKIVSFTVKLMLAFGIIFEEPVVIVLLARLGLVTTESLWSFFPYATVIIFIVAAVITPPDPFSQLMVGFPLLALYLLSIFIVKFIKPKEVPVEYDE